MLHPITTPHPYKPVSPAGSSSIPISPRRPTGIASDEGSIISLSPREKNLSTIERWEKIIAGFASPFLDYLLKYNITSLDQVFTLPDNDRHFRAFLYQFIDSSAPYIFQRKLDEEEKISLKLALEMHILRHFKHKELPKIAQVFCAFSEKSGIPLDSLLFLPHEDFYQFAVVGAASKYFVDEGGDRLKFLYEKSPELVYALLIPILSMLPTRTNFILEWENSEKDFETLLKCCSTEIYETFCAWAEQVMANQMATSEASSSEMVVYQGSTFTPKETKLIESLLSNTTLSSSSAQSFTFADVRKFASNILPPSKLEDSQLTPSCTDAEFFTRLKLGSNTPMNLSFHKKTTKRLQKISSNSSLKQFIEARKTGQ